MSVSSGGAAIILEGLGMAYGTGNKRVQALKNVNAVIRQGEITGLMGPDAAGKTTLMRVMAGLLPVSNGKISIFGRTPLQLKAEEPNSIGYMPQRFGLYEDLSVIANMELYASLRGVYGQMREQLFARLLEFTALGPFKKRLAGDLSGGMKQKLGIACALLGNPRLLLLDEPGVGVDPRSRRDLWNMVCQLAGDGMTVVWATSYFDEGAKFPRLIMLNEGSVLYAGEPQKLTERARGNVYLLAGTGGGQENRRELAYWTQRPGIMDVLIQGKYLRLMVGCSGSEEAAREILAKGGMAAKPVLEDAYLAAVGGIDKRPSPYAGIGQIAGKGNKNGRVISRGLTKKFGNFTAARDITFNVAAGEIVGLLGPNGAGKSTTFRMLCGLLRPTSGDCSVDGVDMLKSSGEAREHLGYMAQKFSLYPDILVRQNISIFANLYGLSREKIKKFVPLMANALDLQDYLRSQTMSLPLGVKKRLALFCATMHVPPVLFLDEPTSGVDVRTRREFWKHISALTAAGAAVLVTTHFMEEAEYCDHIALIYRGSMIEFGSPDELKANVKNVANPTMEDAFIASIDRYDREHPL